jgi:hypothetical protein
LYLQNEVVMDKKKELQKYLGGNAYRRLKFQLAGQGIVPEDLTEAEVYDWKLRDDAATAEMLTMRKLYREKAGEVVKPPKPKKNTQKTPSGRSLRTRRQRRTYAKEQEEKRKSQYKGQFRPAAAEADRSPAPNALSGKNDVVAACKHRVSGL